MAIVDSQTIFSDKQVITKTTLSQRCVDMQALGDYGVGRNLYVHVTTQGDLSNDLRVQILGSTDDTFAEPVLLGDSGVHKSAKLTFGSEFFVRLDETGEKYRYICLRYIPSSTTVTEDTTVSGGKAFTSTEVFAPVSAVGEEEEAVANAVRAELSFVAALGQQYPYANADKVTAG